MRWKKIQRSPSTLHFYNARALLLLFLLFFAVRLRFPCLSARLLHFL